MQPTLPATLPSPESHGSTLWRVRLFIILAAITLLAIWFSGTSTTATICGALGAAGLLGATRIEPKIDSFWRASLTEAPRAVAFFALLLLYGYKETRFPEWEPTWFQAHGAPVLAIVVMLIISAALELNAPSAKSSQDAEDAEGQAQAETEEQEAAQDSPSRLLMVLASVATIGVIAGVVATARPSWIGTTSHALASQLLTTDADSRAGLEGFLRSNTRIQQIAWREEGAERVAQVAFEVLAPPRDYDPETAHKRSAEMAFRKARDYRMVTVSDEIRMAPTALGWRITADSGNRLPTAVATAVASGQLSARPTTALNPFAALSNSMMSGAVLMLMPAAVLALFSMMIMVGGNRRMRLLAIVMMGVCLVMAWSLPSALLM